MSDQIKGNNYVLLTQYLTFFQLSHSGVFTILTVDWNFFLPPNNSPSKCMSLGRSCYEEENVGLKCHTSLFNKDS